MNTQVVIDDLWDYDDPLGTAERFEALLRSDDESFVAEVKTQIARTQGLRRLFDEAHATLDEVSSVLPRVAHRIEARYLLERGRVWNSSGQRDKAREVFLRAFDASKRVGDDDLTVDAAHMLGIVCDGSESLDWQMLGLRILEGSTQERASRWIGPLSNNIAWTYHDLGDFASALAYFERGLAYRRDVGKEPGLRIARWAVARCKRSMGLEEEALREQLSIENDYADAGPYVHEEIGECLLALGRDDEARPHFARAHAVLVNDEWFVKNEGERLERLRAHSGE